MDRTALWARSFATTALAVAMLVGGRASADPAPAAATAAAPPGPEQGANSPGVPFHSKYGFFLEGQVGLFTAFGGEKAASNGQAYTAIQLGGMIPTGDAFVRRVEVFLLAGMGFNDGDCHILEPSVGGCLGLSVPDNSASAGSSPENFVLVPIEVGARVGLGHIVVPEFFPYVMVAVGAALAVPSLAQNSGNVGAGFSAGVGLQYDTRLPGFNFGIEVLVNGAILSWNRPTFTNQSGTFPSTSGSLPLIYLTAYPRFQYVF